jgi:P27 family predicted phage terminase small subunit
MTDKPPKHLGRAAKTWWSRVATEFKFESAGELQCLSEAASSLDRIEQCREILKTEGLFITGDRGSVIHPAARLEQQHRALVLQACRQLGISAPVKP